MDSFTFHIPTNIVFGKGGIAKLPKLVPKDARILLTYGKGSIKKNGVYEQVVAAVKPAAEFSGIEANPEYETLMKAVKVAKENNINFILAVGGGSVVDGSKFVSAAMNWKKTEDPYDICVHSGEPGFEAKAAVPIGVILTLPATGTENNGNGVISRRAKNMKLAFSDISCYPTFSILDPDMINSLPARQVSNGVVDSFVHVMEQYSCHFDKSALADEYSEGTMRVIATRGVEVAKDVMAGKQASYAARADFWWATTQALSYICACGAPQDWATHCIGHELTATFGLDHGVTLACVMPEVLRFEKKLREKKLARMASRVFGVTNATDMAEEAILHLEQFFRDAGISTKLRDHGVKDNSKFPEIAKKFAINKLATEGNLGEPEVLEILNKCL